MINKERVVKILIFFSLSMHSVLLLTGWLAWYLLANYNIFIGSLFFVVSKMLSNFIL